MKKYTYNNTSSNIYHKVIKKFLTKLLNASFEKCLDGLGRNLYENTYLLVPVPFGRFLVPMFKTVSRYQPCSHDWIEVWVCSENVQFQNALLCFRSDWSHHPWPKLLWTHINTASDEQRRTANVKLGYGYGYGYELNIVHMFHSKNAGRSLPLHYCIHQRQSQTRQSFIISLAVIPILGVQCIYTWSLKSCSSPGYSGKVSGALPNGETVHSGTAPSSLHVLNTLQLNFLCTRFLIECWKRALLMR